MKKINHRLYTIFLALTVLNMWLFLIGNMQAVAEELCDLDVTFIERLPRLDFNFPKGEGRDYWYDRSRGWPVKGQTVTFIAHIKNAGKVDSKAFDFCWKIDGEVVKEGRHAPIPPSPANQTLDFEEELKWTWDTEVHTVEFVVDPKNGIEEACEQNNFLLDRTNALTVGFWVERTRYEYYNLRQYEYCIEYGIESNSWEDWAQRQIREWNRMLDESGVEDRIRLDKIIVVDDDKLPLPNGDPDDKEPSVGNRPDKSDKSIDMQWGFPVSCKGKGFEKIEDYPPERNFWETQYIVERSLLHEMSHARTIEDTYGINAAPFNINEYWNKPPFLFPISPFDNLYQFADSQFMGGTKRLPAYGEYLQNAWNSIKGLRALYGNMHWPGVSTYRADLPKKIDIKILDREGRPLYGAKVKIYKYDWADFGIYGYYAKVFHQAPDLERITDAAGVIDLGQDPFELKPSLDFLVPNKLVILVEVEYSSQKSYSFCPAADFHLAYWKGNKEYYANPIRTNIKQQPAPPPIAITTPVENASLGDVPVAVGVAIYDTNLAVAKVEFYVSGKLKYTDNSPPFIWGAKDNKDPNTTNTGDPEGFLTTRYANGSYAIRAKAKDGNGTVLAEDTVNIRVDNSPPFIVYIAPRITASDAGIYWGTELESTSQVEYGLTKDYGKLTPIDNKSVKLHQVKLKDMETNKTYHFRVRSQHYLYGEAVSADCIFHTFPDVTPPVTTDSGIDGEWHKEDIQVTLTATDIGGSGIDKIYYHIMGIGNGRKPKTLYTGPFTISDEGIYFLRYYSIDKAGNKEEIKIAKPIKIDKTAPNILTITAESASTVEIDQLSASCSAVDKVSGIAEYQYKIIEDSKQGRVIKDWFSAGWTGKISVKDLALLYDKTYFFAVRAKNGAGMLSEVGYSNGIKVEAFKITSNIYIAPEEGRGPHNKYRISFKTNRAINGYGYFKIFAKDYKTLIFQGVTYNNVGFWNGKDIRNNEVKEGGYFISVTFLGKRNRVVARRDLAFSHRYNADKKRYDPVF